jgi:hypothetical protein
MKTFTLDEANALLPVLESLLCSARDSKLTLENCQKGLQDIIHRVQLLGGCLVNLADVLGHKSELEKATQHLHDVVAEIDSIGVQVKDLDEGLLDFPCQVEDEIVLLCWKMGEPSVAFWHTQDAGFKGRQPIDERIAKTQRPN